MMAWLADRVGWSELRGGLASHAVPRKSFFFYLGGITLFLLLVLVASGLLLALYYQPDVAQAHASVQRIAGEIPYGNLVRNVHVWAGDLFVALLFLHAFTILLRRSFRPPHELSWWSGLLACALGVGLAFTGAILPWNEAAYTHARVGSELAGNTPLVGDWLRGFLRGGPEVGAETLRHAFGFHVAVLPAAMTLLVLLHLGFLVRKPPSIGQRPKETIPLYPDFFVRQAVALTGVLVVIMTLAIFVERPLGEAADLRAPSPAGALPPWYFLPIHEIVRSAPKQLLGIDGARFLMGAACLVGLFAVALPFIDRKGSKITMWAAWVLLLVLALESTCAIR